ncbi:MAG: double-strand break repair helicase AddA [Beijerinckiaceae bacterium]|jgi:ATP-dependent helicase/nuclease subunit A|nr:double-strand break repair helicase AddA [Beijerinckiaceae bacterium]
MSEQAQISAELEARRQRAIQPKESAWVAANAGAGKTSLLRDRVLRLLLEGVSPDHILCLTFTKAAAAEMQGRIFETLSGWVSTSDEALANAIGKLLGPDATAAAHASAFRRARQLFAEAVETPGGLKIQTIHAFSERLLHLLPVEAGVPVNFTVLDDAEHASLCEEARRRVVLEATRKPRSRLAGSFATLTEVLTPQTFARAVEAGMIAWRKLSKLGALASPEAMDAAVEALLQIQPDLTESTLEERLFEALPPSQEAQAMAAAIRAAKGAGTRAIEGAQRLEKFALSRDAARLDHALDFVLTKDREDRKNPVPKAVVDLVPGLDSFIDDWKQAAGTFITRRRALRTARQSRALGDFSRAMLAAYEALKAESRALDFDDLIDRLRAMLTSGQADWVKLKLDAAIEHILVDEAQDTSAAMWEIVSELADDFFSGQGQVNRPRSLFVVGDQKQSIFSFQGAAPEVFEQKRLDFAARMRASDNLVRNPVRLNVSFRSADEVLSAVDAVFSDPLRRLGLTSTGVAETHNAAFPLRPGLVECWPLEAKLDGDTTSSEKRLAERIARTIAGWLETGETSLITGKPVRPGDILILVRTRGAFFAHIMRALSLAGVPVAGSDRIDIGSEIAVRDLLAIAQAALLPLDDLTLATALKTPHFGLDDAALEPLCRGREGSLRAEIARWAAEDPAFTGIDAALARCEALALTASPHDFFARLLIAECPAAPGLSGRRALLQRLGADAADALDAFLTDALAFEERHPASLALFLAAQAARAHEIKRDPEAGGDKVRIMTVHGAKGLEAPIVFLTECGSLPGDGQEPNIAAITENPAGPLFLWAVRKDDEAAPLVQQREMRKAKQMEEYRRLLYVGLTRARERLYVVGHLTGKAKPRPVDVPPEKKAAPEWPWHALVASGLSESQVVQHIPGRDDPEKILRWPPQPRSQKPSPEKQDPPAKSMTAPDWVLNPLPAERRQGLLIPSHGASPEPEGQGTPPARRAEARREGIFIHRLFQFLPRFPNDERPRLALDLLRQEFGEDAESRQARLVEPVIALFSHPEFAPFLTPDWRAEVALAGWVTAPSGEKHFVPARMDRLRWREDRIEIIDFKTGYRPTTGPDSRILAQMALYRALLKQLFGASRVDCHLGWFAHQRIETLAEAELDAAFTRL